jgi:hypothetical protein
MVIDGLPSGTSILERFHWEALGMTNAHRARLADRFTQLFGRINRGRKDFGVFVVNGTANKWLSNQRNIALLPDVLKKQVLLGLSIHEQQKFENDKSVIDMTRGVLQRDPDWLDYYIDSMEGLAVDDEAFRRAEQAEAKMVVSGIAEVKFMSEIWRGDIAAARRSLEECAEEILRGDSKVAGWHNAWTGICYMAEGDLAAAKTEFDAAKARLQPNLLLVPVVVEQEQPVAATASNFVKKAANVLSMRSEEAFRRRLAHLRKGVTGLQDDASPSEAEESVRFLGELLGFEATRPDNDLDAGPDAMWIAREQKLELSFELKTDKKKGAALYNKSDIGKGHDYEQWAKENCGECEHTGLIFVGPAGTVTEQSNPSDTMFHIELSELRALAEVVLAGISDARGRVPLERIPTLSELEEREGLSLAALAKRFSTRSMRSLRAQPQ